MDQHTARPIQFRLAHAFYAMTLLASSLALCGGYGVFPFLAILVFWGYVYFSRSRPRALVHGCLVVFVGFCLFNLLLFASPAARETARRAHCRNSLRHILFALHSYHEVYGRFPPACVRDKDGKPMHSWRVLLLPFLEQQVLYKQYCLDEPWDGPNNRKLLSGVALPIYECRSDTRPHGLEHSWTSYVAVVGPRTFWGDDRGRRMDQIPEATAETVMVVEYQGGQIAWAEPRDLELTEALEVLASQAPEDRGVHRSENFLFEWYDGRWIGFADCDVRFVYGGVPRNLWSTLLTIDDGVPVSDEDLRGAWDGSWRLKTGNCLRLVTFVLLTFLPLPWCGASRVDRAPMFSSPRRRET